MILAENNIDSMKPSEFRNLVRRSKWRAVTTNACSGYAQTNLVIVPRSLAFEFLLFCYRNPGPCPVIEVTDPGEYHPKFSAPEADLRTDLSKYKVFKNGEIIDEPIQPIESNETIMSWACGVTPQICAVSSKVPFMISHFPGHMFVSDKLSEELSVF